MEVYHGSNVIVDKPALIRQQRTLDFGPGFYTTINREQAVVFAKKVGARQESDKCFVSVYKIPSLDVLRTKMDLLEFLSPNHKWLDYVFENRSGIYSGRSYDVIVGPVANDSIYRTFIAYEAGILTKDETVARLKVKKLYNQITFSTEMALSSLKYTEYFEA